MKLNVVTKTITILLTAAVCASMMGCGKSKPKTQPKPQPTQAPQSVITYPDDVDNSIGARIDELNKKSGFYHESAETLTDGTQEFKQIVLPEGWEKINTKYLDADNKKTTEKNVFKNIDKEIAIKKIARAIVNAVDGPKAYTILKPTAKGEIRSSDIDEQGKEMFGKRYEEKNNDEYVRNNIADGSHDHKYYYRALAENTMKEWWEKGNTIVNPFGGPYVFYSNMIKVSDIQKHNRIMIKSIDGVAIKRGHQKFPPSTREQTYVNTRSPENPETLQVTLYITYRLPIKIRHGDELLAKPLKAAITVTSIINEPRKDETIDEDTELDQDVDVDDEKQSGGTTDKKQSDRGVEEKQSASVVGEQSGKQSGGMRVGKKKPEFVRPIAPIYASSTIATKGMSEVDKMFWDQVDQETNLEAIMSPVPANSDS